MENGLLDGMLFLIIVVFGFYLVKLIYRDWEE